MKYCASLPKIRPTKRIQTVIPLLRSHVSSIICHSMKIALAVYGCK